MVFFGLRKATFLNANFGRSLDRFHFLKGLHEHPREDSTLPENIPAVPAGSNSTGGAVPGPPVNPVTNKIYVANNVNINMTAITEQDVQPSSPYTSINGFPEHSSKKSNPTFTIQAESVYTPTTPNVQQVYFQVDTSQGEWLSATENLLTPSQITQWSAQIPPQDNGVHILYAYAVDGQGAGSVNPSPSYSPIIGRISAYLFLVRAKQSVTFHVSFLPLVWR